MVPNCAIDFLLLFNGLFSHTLWVETLANTTDTLPGMYVKVYCEHVEFVLWVLSRWRDPEEILTISERYLLTPGVGTAWVLFMSSHLI
jgi:hypothetical protein